MSPVTSSTSSITSPYASVTEQVKPGKFEANEKEYGAVGAAVMGVGDAVAEGASATVSLSEKALSAVEDAGSYLGQAVETGFTDVGSAAMAAYAAVRNGARQRPARRRERRRSQLGHHQGRRRGRRRHGRRRRARRRGRRRGGGRRGRRRLARRRAPGLGGRCTASRRAPTNSNTWAARPGRPWRTARIARASSRARPATASRPPRASGRRHRRGGRRRRQRRRPRRQLRDRSAPPPSNAPSAPSSEPPPAPERNDMPSFKLLSLAAAAVALPGCSVISPAPVHRTGQGHRRGRRERDLHRPEQRQEHRLSRAPVRWTPSASNTTR